MVSGDFVVDHEHVIDRDHDRELDVVVAYQVTGGAITRVWFLPRHDVRGAPPAIAIVGGTVVRPDRAGADAAMADATIVVEGDRIRTIGPARETPVPAGARVVDAKGKWITAGFVDAHVHFFQSGNPYTRPDAIDLTRRVPYADEVRRLRRPSACGSQAA
jgi:hypothetical protein